MENIELDVRNALISLSNTIKKSPEESSLSRSEECLAYLHAYSFGSSPTATISAIEFVDRVYEQTNVDVSGVDDNIYEKFVPMIKATSVAYHALYAFVDDIRSATNKINARVSQTEPIPDSAPLAD